MFETEKREENNNMKKRLAMGMMLLIASFAVSGCGVSQEEYQTLKADYANLQKLVEDMQKEQEEFIQTYQQPTEVSQAIQDRMGEYENYLRNHESRLQQLESGYGSLTEQIGNQQSYIQGYISEQQLREYARSFSEDIPYEELRDNADAYMEQKIRMTGVIQEISATENALELIVAIDGDTSKLMLFTGPLEWAQGGYQTGTEVTLLAQAAGTTEYFAEETTTEETVEEEAVEEEAVEEEAADEETVDEKAFIIPMAVFEYII